MKQLRNREARLLTAVPAHATEWVTVILLGVGAAFGMGLGR